MAPDGSGRPRRERTGLRRRPGPGRRSGRGAEGAPPAERARGRLRGAGAGARAGSRGGYDDPAAGPRISSPPPPLGSPSSRLRTRHTGGESGRAGGKGPRAGAPSYLLPEAGPGRPRALREARPAGDASLGVPPPGTGRRVLRPGLSRSRRGLRSQESEEAQGLFSGQLPLPPATCLLGVLLSSNDRGPPCVSSLGRFFPPSVVADSQCVACACVFHSSADHHGCGLFVLFGTPVNLNQQIQPTVICAKTFQVTDCGKVDAT